MIDALQTILVALVDAIDAQVAGPVIWARRTALADLDRDRSRLGPHLALMLVAGALPQGVQMRHRDRRQALLTSFSEQAMRAFHELLGGQAGERAMQRVGLRQQAHVSTGVGQHKTRA